jgi:hypothetical protein
MARLTSSSRSLSHERERDLSVELTVSYLALLRRVGTWNLPDRG